jgi:hypothetical protein
LLQQYKCNPNLYLNFKKDLMQNGKPPSGLNSFFVKDDRIVGYWFIDPATGKRALRTEEHAPPSPDTYSSAGRSRSRHHPVGKPRSANKPHGNMMPVGYFTPTTSGSGKVLK